MRIDAAPSATFCVGMRVHRRQDARAAFVATARLRVPARTLDRFGNIYGDNCRPLLLPAADSLHDRYWDDWQAAERLPGGALTDRDGAAPGPACGAPPRERGARRRWQRGAAARLARSPPRDRPLFAGPWSALVGFEVFCTGCRFSGGWRRNSRSRRPDDRDVAEAARGRGTSRSRAPITKSSPTRRRRRSATTITAACRAAGQQKQVPGTGFERVCWTAAFAAVGRAPTPRCCIRLRCSSCSNPFGGASGRAMVHRHARYARLAASGGCAAEPA
jgi:hypothetical protein